MNDHVDFIPKKAEVAVGEISLVVAELVAAQRDALVKMVGEKIQAVNVRAMLRQTRELVEQDGKQDGKQVEQAAGGATMLDIVLEVFTGMLTDAECVVLDIPENRKRVAVVLGDEYTIPKLEDMPLHDSYGVEHWKPLWFWVRSNITDKQGLALVRQVIQLNDFANLVKNFATLATGLVPGLGEGQEQTQTTSVQ